MAHVRHHRADNRRRGHDAQCQRALEVRRCGIEDGLDPPETRPWAEQHHLDRVNPAWSPGHNLIEFTFLDPRAHTVYPHWDEIALQAVAGLRATATARRGELDGFVADMRERSETFRALWDSHDVYERTMGEKQLRVDGIGILGLKFETFALTGPEGHVLYVYFPQPGSTEDEALRNLT
jgi:hypothetical protein